MYKTKARSTTGEAKSQGKRWHQEFFMSKGATGGAKFRSKVANSRAKFMPKGATGGADLVANSGGTGALYDTVSPECGSGFNEVPASDRTPERVRNPN